MSAKRKQKEKQLKSGAKESATKASDSNNQEVLEQSRAEIAAEHLAPLSLVFIVLACSGFLFVLGFRDVMATGKIILGDMDAAFMDYTKSMHWFEDSMGWRSTQGGLSVIQQVTTDENDMGGLFVRKMAGAAMLAVALQKLLPVLFHPIGTQWKRGHFRPLLMTSILSNIMVAGFYAIHLDDLTVAGADTLPKYVIAALGMETITMIYYLVTQKSKERGPSIAMPEGKSPKSIPSRIVARTIGIVSGFMLLIAGRDLFFPGQILDFIPRDDIYLEWTGAFLHSPPEGSAEAADQGMEAPLYAGDKFVSQLLALHIVVLCMYKFATAFFIRFGSDGSGTLKCRIISRSAALGDLLLLFLIRLFQPAALSASLDLRWHLMSLGYECFILGLYGFF